MRMLNLLTVILLTILTLISLGCSGNPSVNEVSSNESNSAELVPSNPFIVEAESRWHESPGDAEAEARSIMDRSLRQAESSIRRAGGRVERVLHDPARMTERKNGDSSEWKAKMRSRITWSADSNLLSSEEVGILPRSFNVMDHLLNVLGDTPGTRPFRMQIDNLTAVGGEISVDESKMVKLPERIREDVYIFDNLLGSQEIKHDKNFTVETEVGHTVTVETSMSQTKEITASLQFPSITIGASGTKTFSLTKNNTQNFRKVETLTERLEFVIPPRKKVVITLRMVESTSRYPFTGALVFEGTWYHRRNIARSLSSTVSEDRRRVGVNGVIDDAKVRDFKLTVVETDQ